MPTSRLCAFAILFALLSVSAGCKKGKKNEAPPDTAPPPTIPGGNREAAGSANTGQPTGGQAPAGWFEARDTIGGYRVLLPGPVNPIDMSRAGGRELQPTGYAHQFRNPDKDPRTRVYSLLAPAALKLGTTPDELLEALKVFVRTIDTHHVLLEKTPVTLGGNPALKVVLKPKFLGVEKLPDDPEFAREELERRKKEDAKRKTYYVTTSRSRIIIIEIETPTDPDPAFLKTLTDSFAFQ